MRLVSPQSEMGLTGKGGEGEFQKNARRRAEQHVFENAPQLEFVVSKFHFLRHLDMAETVFDRDALQMMWLVKVRNCWLPTTP